VPSQCSSRESNPERFGFADHAIVRMKGALRAQRARTVRLVELAEQRAKARATQAPDEHAAPAATSSQPPGAPDGGMAVHVREDDDHVRTFDDGGKRFASAAVHLAGVALELVPASPSNGLQHARGSIVSTDDGDFHGEGPEAEGLS